MKDLSRRDAIKVIGAAAGAVGISAVPDAWETPAIEAASLPVAAAASPVPTATPIPILVVAITQPILRAIFQTLTPTIVGTSTPGSAVTVSLDGLPAIPATSAANGNWSVVVSPPLMPISPNSTVHAVEAWANKVPSAQAHAGPVEFWVSNPTPSPTPSPIPQPN